MTDRFKRLAPLTAVPMVGLVVAVLAMPSSPDSNASGAKVIAFYHQHQSAIQVQSFLLAYAGFVAVIYFASVAGYLRRRGSDVLATTAVAGAVLFAVGLCVAAGLNAALADSPRKLGTSAAQALNVLQNDAFGFVLFAGLGLAVGSIGIAMLRTHSLPKALGIITVIVGVAAATPAGWFALLASGPLTLVIAAYVYRALGRPTEITLPADSTVGIPAARMSSEASSRSTEEANS